MEAKSIDDILVASMNETPVPKVEVVNPVNVDVKDESLKEEKLTEIVQEVVDEVPAKEEKVSKSDSTIDEYGNPVEKQRVYTEDEVQQLIRDRVARNRQQEQVNHQPSQYPPQVQEEDWETQLKSVIKKTIVETQEEISQNQWKQEEASRQSEFESKFSQGMNKHGDFHEVVAGKPITDSMMMATRSLENPASFIYAAAKFHPQELNRISKISDPYSQASEIGRLHEKMVKSRNLVSSAPKPLEVINSDMAAKRVNDQPSIEERIQQYAKQKRK